MNFIIYAQLPKALALFLGTLGHDAYIQLIFRNKTEHLDLMEVQVFAING